MEHFGVEISTKYTNMQLSVEKIMNELGFQTVLEYEVGNYSIDIYIPELNLAVEVDGFGHYKKRDVKRDAKVLEISGMKTLRIKPKDLKKEIINQKISEMFNIAPEGE